MLCAYMLLVVIYVMCVYVVGDYIYLCAYMLLVIIYVYVHICCWWIFVHAICVKLLV